MFGFLPNIGPWELIAILAIVLIIFGPGKLPDVGKSLGKTIKEFRKASKETTDQVEEALKEPIKETEK
ncbi:Sec-independent protein translocase subunit TatA/TatB [Syntrophaceticus schinkii]|jgi:sec-independent protein translocase protein TatA|uniref:Sec-independent protein translocase protein TatA n=1 Tax=Syntrophaceticus schinkii TaxID=499207 RepID=A0A0B7MHJ8_9FIRM|nr:twin-arginine translocase TatA/TatE family subunit [Syntrophaceticus schinkii]MDD2360592.1 twin-arginine translocase TatA/TatE family subunit [Syntrophaceticus schinkii]MDD4262214.1 twin-arginine translocase TatA/TatE family subunit [Syntrophaceticus schinkii]MDD4674150.1 twin-arginine translocase TatA/TatE family subunit [Syntrophaceticus schinkii]CEO89535.1 Sec-independent protein translocase protein TatA [Syntrophaceticus schinkii]